MTKVFELMVKDVITVSPKETMSNAAKKMKDNSVSSLIVTEGNEIKGIITRSDFVDRVVAEDLNPNSTSVGDVMTKAIVTIEARTSILEALRVMKNKKYSQLPVVQEGKLAGVISLRSALNYLAKFFLISGWRQD